MHNKTVFVLLDGLQSEYAKEHLGYLEHLCEKQRAAKYEVLPALHILPLFVFQIDI